MAVRSGCGGVRARQHGITTSPRITPSQPGSIGIQVVAGHVQPTGTSAPHGAHVSRGKAQRSHPQRAAEQLNGFVAVTTNKGTKGARKHKRKLREIEE